MCRVHCHLSCHLSRKLRKDSPCFGETLYPALEPVLRGKRYKSLDFLKHTRLLIEQTVFILRYTITQSPMVLRETERPCRADGGRADRRVGSTHTPLSLFHTRPCRFRGHRASVSPPSRLFPAVSDFLHVPDLLSDTMLRGSGTVDLRVSNSHLFGTSYR